LRRSSRWSEAQRRGYLQRALWRRTGAGDAGVRLFDSAHYLQARFVIQHALLGRPDPTGGAVQKPHTDMAFELLDTVADHGGRQPHIPRRRREAAEFHDTHKDPDIF
jgi:hypothetical protein